MLNKMCWDSYIKIVQDGHPFIVIEIWLFSHKDLFPSLAEKARAAFLESPETMTRMSANARARYLKLFSADSQFRIMTELYKRLGLDLLAS
jgi:hypothetical protein